MRVAINGTGIAGPTLAHWLRRFGHEPVLFERAPELRTRGYIIDFWGLGFEIADRMGLVPALLERCYKMERQRMVDAAGREVAGMDVEGAKRAQIRCANQPAAGAGLFNLFVRHSKFVAVIPATTLAIVARRVTANWGTSTASVGVIGDGYPARGRPWTHCPRNR